jgi:hypothetical protein
MTMTLQETITVGSGGASLITFSSIPQTGTDLLLTLMARSTSNSGGVTDYMPFKFNNTTSGRVYRSMYRSDNSTYASNGTQLSTFAGATGADATASTFSSVSMYIPNYTLSGKTELFLEAVTENNATASWIEILGGASSSSGAITSIELDLSFGNFAQYSTASLYIIS